jgi:metal-responsive CopG/Arc/MetJ family transcriptional regulator
MGKTRRSRSRTVSVKLPVSLADQLMTTASRRGVSKSTVVREALMKAVGDGDRGHRRRRSVLALARDIIGRLEGPGDLSYHPKHMRGFGR